MENKEPSKKEKNEVTGILSSLIFMAIAIIVMIIVSKSMS